MYLFIKIRWPNEKRWFFAGSGGKTTRLRFHASLYPEEKVVAVLDDLHTNNPELGFKAVPANRHDPPPAVRVLLTGVGVSHIAQRRARYGHRN